MKSPNMTPGILIRKALWLTSSLSRRWQFVKLTGNPVPDRSFRDRLIIVRFWQVPKSRFWNFPVKLLPEISRNLMVGGPWDIKPVGISPESRLLERSRDERYLQEERDVGRFPVSLLPEKLSMIIFRQLERETDNSEESESLFFDKLRERRPLQVRNKDRTSSVSEKLFADKSSL